MNEQTEKKPEWDSTPEDDERRQREFASHFPTPVQPEPNVPGTDALEISKRDHAKTPHSKQAGGE